MKKALLLFSTREGQTKKILERIQDNLDGYECDWLNIHEQPQVNFADYERVVIGASIRYGHLNKNLYAFIQSNLPQLEQNKVAFICVNLTARKEEQLKDTPEGSAYIKTFLGKSPWKPELIGVFAGALRYPRYGFFDKFMIRLIMSMTGGETDTSKEVEYTNWNKVEKFAESIKNM